jgi:hypothetical protein
MIYFDSTQARAASMAGVLRDLGWNVNVTPTPEGTSSLTAQSPRAQESTMASRAIYWNVKPRYTPGSPAQVDQATAERVAGEERLGYVATLDGAHGTIAAAEAKIAGLRGIVEMRWERPGAWIVHDLLTNERFIRPFTVERESDRAKENRLMRLTRKYDLPLEGQTYEG